MEGRSEYWIRGKTEERKVRQKLWEIPHLCQFEGHSLEKVSFFSNDFNFKSFIKYIPVFLRIHFELLKNLLFIYLFIYCLLESHLQHMEVPRLGTELELQLPAYTTAHDDAGPLIH